MAAQLGSLHPLLDLANLMRVPAAIIVLLCSVILVFRYRGVLARIILSGAAIAAGFTLLPSANLAPDCKIGGQQLRIAWLNIGASSQADGRLLDWIVTQNADIVGLAELAPRRQELSAAMDAHYPYRQSCLKNGRCSTVLFSRNPPAEGQALARGDPENRKALSAATMRFDRGVADQPFSIYAVHLSQAFPLYRQRDELSELDLSLSKPNSMIVIGDFNLTPAMKTLSQFAARNGLRPAIAGPTWPAGWDGGKLVPIWQIDQLLLGPGWTVKSIHRSPDVGSDHLGFVADLCSAA